VSLDSNAQHIIASVKEKSRPLHFVEEPYESQDVCHDYSIRQLHGFFTSPVSCSVTDTLVPVFSPSKIPPFADILYPPIWYWVKLINTEYDEDDDMDWTEKKDLLYWTGSATGGYATLGNWRDLHRQRLIFQTTSAHASAVILEQSQSEWRPRTIPASNISQLFDVRITSVPSDQCEPAACEEMRRTFLRDENDRRNRDHPQGKVKSDREAAPKLDPLSAGYAAKYVLDMDGNAFSGRFYRLLLSNSAVLKQTMFQEWHDGRLVPWVHFIPISPGALELGEVMRFLTQDDRGREIGKAVARQGREWARKTLRMVDLELTMLRILMEYGRLVSDERTTMEFRM
jgi:hypothetical protein